MSVERVFVAGAGLMGHGIAQIHAVIGLDVHLYEPDLGRAQAGRERIAAALARAVEKGRLSATDRDSALERIVATDRLEDAATADVVIEAVFEDIDVKHDLWRRIDAIAPGHAIFASNTSSISIHRLAEAIRRRRRGRFIGMHFFSPVPAMPLVEVIRGRETDDATVGVTRQLAEDLGKHVIVSADRPGFIVNRILFPLIVEAIRALEEGLGAAEDIDTGARVGLNHPMGPLELADFIGLDVVLGILRALEDGLGRGGAHFHPPRTLEDLVAAGHLGQKTGRGFYTYPRG
jgi:3-hydroxybutyryl-CoA dehydrogenase